MLKANSLKAATVTVKVRYSDLRSVTRSRTLAHYIIKTEEILSAALSLLNKTEAGKRPVRLLGISVSKVADLSTPEPPLQILLHLPKSSSPQ